ncbi:hypothetical protein Gotri_003882 [Gossypium trilobum]|uniref:Uncharacterized protein n=1 Tax=Gossypium trilobum TaxID=34281 RepID=A0A7J9F3Y7_9ROSI|nr:hypothetical protein [Gossypium trilobum]
MGGGSTNVPVNIACFELIKPSFDETNHHCSLDVLPILIEETSFPVREKCSLNTSHVSSFIICCCLFLLPYKTNQNQMTWPKGGISKN